MRSKIQFSFTMKVSKFKYIFLILFTLLVVPARNQESWARTLLKSLTQHLKSHSPMIVVFPESQFLFEETEKNITTVLIELQDSTGGITVLRTRGGNHSLQQDTLAWTSVFVLVILTHGPTDPRLQLQSAIYDLKDMSGWKTLLPHLVIIEEMPGYTKTGKNDILNILTELWHLKIYHSTILIINSSNSSTYMTEANVYWWEPLGFANDCNGPTETAIQTTTLFNGLPPLLFGPLPNYWQGCKLIAATLYGFPPFIIENPDPGPDKPVVIDGQDFRIASEISRRLNFTIEYVLADYQKGPEMLNNGSAHIMLGSYVIYSLWMTDHGISPVYGVIKTTWFVPCGLPVPRWLSVALVFSPILWLSVAVSSVTVIGIFAIFRVTGLHDNMPTSFRVLYMLIGVTTDREPSGLLTSGLFLVWLLSAFIINNSYQSGLGGLLVNPGMFPPISSIEELIDSKLTIGLHEGYREIFEAYDEPMFKTFISRSRECNDIQKCIERVAHSRDMAVAYDLSSVDYFLIGRDRRLLTILQDVQIWHCVMYYPKGSPLKELWDKNLNGLIQGSIQEYWWRDLQKSHEPLGGSRKDNEPSDPVVMTLEHLEGPFFILFIGLGLSSIVFIIEIILNRRVEMDK